MVTCSFPSLRLRSWWQDLGPVYLGFFRPPCAISELGRCPRTPAKVGEWGLKFSLFFPSPALRLGVVSAQWRCTFFCFIWPVTFSHSLAVPFDFSSPEHCGSPVHLGWKRKGIKKEWMDILCFQWQWSRHYYFCQPNKHSPASWPHFFPGIYPSSISSLKLESCGV